MISSTIYHYQYQLRLMLIALVCAASVIATFNVAQAQGQSCTATANANVRGGSSTAFPVVGTLQKGDIVTLIEASSNGWVRHGEDRWTSGALLNCGGSSASTGRVSMPTVQLDIAGLMKSPYMTNYQKSLAYTNPAPAAGIPGFIPVPSLNKGPFDLPDGYQVRVPQAPTDVLPYSCFPQDYGYSDSFNRGCADKQKNGQLPWKTPIAGFSDSNNWECGTPDGWCPSTVSPFNWQVTTGFRVCHPAVGCIQDPNGGAAELVIVNFHDSVETWNVRTASSIFVDDGWQGYGMMFSLNGDAHNVGEGIATIRNHFLHELSYPVGGDNRYAGQCGSSKLCQTVTYVVVARVWDRPSAGINYSHFVLLDAGQWERPN